MDKPKFNFSGLAPEPSQSSYQPTQWQNGKKNSDEQGRVRSLSQVGSNTEVYDATFKEYI